MEWVSFVYESYDILVQIYGWSASAQPLDFGIHKNLACLTNNPKNNLHEDPQENFETPASLTCAPGTLDVIEETLVVKGGSNGKRKIFRQDN